MAGDHGRALEMHGGVVWQWRGVGGLQMRRTNLDGTQGNTES